MHKPSPPANEDRPQHGRQFSMEGTIRPFSWLPPRRQRNKPKRSPSHETRERVAYIRWLRERIIETTEYADHFEDPRWDRPPPEWSFKNFLSSRSRDAKL